HAAVIVTARSALYFNKTRSRSERREDCGLAGALEQQREQRQRPGLRQGLVEVAALGGLHAGGAAARAGALGDQAVGVPAELLETRECGARYPDPARVAVVDEDRRPAGLRVVVGGQPADVPAVAHGDQREDRDLGVLGGVQGAQQRLQRHRLARGELLGVELEPQRLGGKALRG